MALYGVDYLDLGGGVDAGSAPNAIHRRQFTELLNFYPYGGTRLRRRGGHTLVTTGGAGTPAPTAAGFNTSLFPLQRADETYALVVGATTGFKKVSGQQMVLLPSPDLSFGSDLLPWVMFQYKDFAYAIRRNTGGLLRLAPDVVRRAGLAAPTVAPTLADGGAGALPSGTYKAVYTFFNTATGVESNPSPAGTLALGASKKINYSAIATSTNPFTDARRIYRTINDQQNEYYFVAQISNNVDTTFNGDEVVARDLGRPVSFTNGLPPTDMVTGAVWQERLFCTDGRDLFYSNFLAVEAFDPEAIISVFPDDGYTIMALHGFGDRLIIGKTNATYYLVGAGPGSFALHVLSDRHGVMSQYSVQSSESTLFWLGSGKSVFRSDGTSVREISTPRVKPFLDLVPDSMLPAVVATVVPEENWYVLSLPVREFVLPEAPPPKGSPESPPEIEGSPGSVNGMLLIYNYRDDAWAVFKGTAAVGGPQQIIDTAPDFLAHIEDSDGQTKLFATYRNEEMANSVFLYNQPAATTDPALQAPATQEPIVATATTKADDFDAPGLQKFFSEVWLLVKRVAGGLVGLEVLRDRETTPILNRTASLDIAGNSYKAYKLPTTGRPGSELQLRLTYTGAETVDIDALHFEVGVTERKPRRPL